MIHSVCWCLELRLLVEEVTQELIEDGVSSTISILDRRNMFIVLTMLYPESDTIMILMTYFLYDLFYILYEPISITSIGTTSQIGT